MSIPPVAELHIPGATVCACLASSDSSSDRFKAHCSLGGEVPSLTTGGWLISV